MKKNKLFALIQTMTKGEQRLFISKGTYDRKYLKLFAALSSMPSYDEKLLRKVLNGEKMLTQLHVAKNYLFETLLAFLTQNSSHSSLRDQLTSELNKIDVLFSRGLVADCSMRLKKIKPIVIKNEWWQHLLRIVDMESALIRKTYYRSSTPLALRKLEKERKHTLLLSEREHEYLAHNERIKNDYIIHGQAHTKDDVRRIKKILAEPILSDSALPSTFLSKQSYYLSRSRCFYSLGKYKECRKEARSALMLFEKNPAQKRNAPLEYYSALLWFYGASFLVEDYAVLSGVLDRMRNIEMPTHLLTGQTLVTTFSNELSLLLHHKKYEKLLVFIRENERAIKKYGTVISQIGREILYFNISYAYFSLGEYENALTWLNKILNTKELITGLDFRISMRFYNLILHYELDSSEYLEYEIPATYAYVYKRKKLFQGEKALLKLLKSISQSSSPFRKSQALNTFCQYTDSIKDTSSELVFNQYFDVFSWAEKKKNDLLR